MATSKQIKDLNKKTTHATNAYLLIQEQTGSYDTHAILSQDLFTQAMITGFGQLSTGTHSSPQVKVKSSNGTESFTVQLSDTGTVTLQTTNDALTEGFLFQSAASAGDTIDFFRVAKSDDAVILEVDAANKRVGILKAAPTVPLDVVGQALITNATAAAGLGIVQSSSGIGLSMTNSGSGDSININAGTANDFVVDAAGNVGIGIDPGNALSVLDTTVPQARISYDADGYATFGVADGGSLAIQTYENNSNISLTTTGTNGSVILTSTGTGDVSLDSADDVIIDADDDVTIDADDDITLTSAGETISLATATNKANGSIFLTPDSTTSGKGVVIEDDDLTSGTALFIHSTSTSATSRELVEVKQTGGADNATNLRLTNSGAAATADYLLCHNNTQQKLAINTNGHIETDAGITVNNTNVPEENGAIRYHSGDFEGYKASGGWTSFTAAASGGDANEYSFKTITFGGSASAQADVVADADDDTLTLVAGANVTITTTADQITFVATDTNTTYSVQDGELSENNFTNADHTKLNGIEASADVTDATNVAAAGALMDSELTDIAAVKATEDPFTAALLSKLNAIEASATADQTAGEILTLLEDGVDSVHYKDGSIDLVHMSSESVDEDNLHISNTGSNGQFLSKQSGDTGGLTWATPSGSGSGDITSVVAGVGLSGGATTGDATLTVDFSEFSTVTPANGDFLAALDSDGAQEQKTAVSALATLFAGSGLTATNSIIAVDTLNQDTSGNAATVTTNANLTGHITSVGNAASLGTFSAAQLSTALSDASISGSNTGDQTNISGNAATATALETARNINGVSFNGTGNITVTAAGTTLSDTVPVTKGGTNATSLTDGGILLGSGTGAITAMSALGDGVIVVGDGSGDPTTLTALTASDLLKHEVGGLELDISAIAIGDVLAGTGTGALGIVTSTGHADGQVLTLQADGTADWEAAAGGSVSVSDDNNNTAHTVVFHNESAGTLHDDTGAFTYNPSTGQITAVQFVGGSAALNPFGTSSGETGSLFLYELAANGSNYVWLRAPDNIAATFSLTLPADDGDSGEFLQTDGDGVLSWAGSGISDGDVLTANDAVADDDFLRINGTEVEGLTVAEVLTALNVEAGADVTDATNVAAAGALMDSELAGIAAVKATTGTFLSADESKLDGIEASATADQTATEILALVLSGTTANGVVTYNSSSAASVESDLTFTGGALTVSGTTPTITIGDAGAEDTKLVFDGNGADFYVGLDETDDDLKIGLGSAVGTTPVITVEDTGAVTFGVDDTGYDVTMRGATSGSFCRWDESADHLRLASSAFSVEQVPAANSGTTVTGDSGATINIDWSRGNYHWIVLGAANVTKIIFQNMKRGARYVLRVEQGATPRTVSWGNVDYDESNNPFTEVRWVGGTAPTMSTTASRVDVYGFLCTRSNGRGMDGFVIAQNLAEDGTH